MAVAVIFDRKTLQKSSLAGKKKDAVQLDPKKVKMIIGRWCLTACLG
jgi:hypothetical protein